MCLLECEKVPARVRHDLEEEEVGQTSEGDKTHERGDRAVRVETDGCEVSEARLCGVVVVIARMRLAEVVVLVVVITDREREGRVREIEERMGGERVRVRVQ